MRRTIATLLLVASGFAAAVDKPRDIRDQMVKVENEYFALYNKLNTDHQYDMVCRNERPTGSSIQTRVCQPRYILTAREDAASERMHSAITASESSGPASARGPEVVNAASGGAARVQLSKEQAFRDNMLSVLQKSPELQALGKQRDELQARYEAATKGSGSRQAQ